MNYVLFDESRRNNLLPLTFMRPVADIRFGILTIREKWEYFLKCKTSTLTENYLSAKFPLVKEKENIIINGAVCPNDKLVDEIGQLQAGQALVKGDTVIAMYLNEADFEKPSGAVEEVETEAEFLEINNTWDIFAKNGLALAFDYELITKGRKSQKIPAHCLAMNPENIFIEPGAEILASTLNASAGPIYIGKEAVVMEGSNLRGPIALCEHAQVKMGAKIYGATTIGPGRKWEGSEQQRDFRLFQQSHDGFLGHSVIAEWCNLGADTNTSNLKNTYDR
jgi:UDP-N-acetylglucosamine diphosphorylase/glucosamine-1-phosphate N-acetyltransferase